MYAGGEPPASVEYVGRVRRRISTDKISPPQGVGEIYAPEFVYGPHQVDARVRQSGR